MIVYKSKRRSGYFKSKIFVFIEKACGLVLFCWLYAIGWNIPPFVGWGRYIPEGILDSCSFDYLSRDAMVTLKGCVFVNSYIF